MEPKAGSMIEIGIGVPNSVCECSHSALSCSCMHGPEHYSPEPPVPSGICWSTLRNTQLILTRGF